MNIIHRVLPVIVVMSVFVSGMTMKAQSFEEQLSVAENIKAQYGETDDRYLDALSQAISAAFAEQKNEEANKYRLIHAAIVKGKYGENSLEYAEDMWRLGNVSDFKGVDYTFSCYKKAENIYDSLNAQTEFPYCDIMWRLYWYYYDNQEWEIALNYLKKRIDCYKIWLNVEWNGLSLDIVGLAHSYLLLGILYQYNIQDLLSSLEAYKTSISIIEENKLFTAYEYALMPYSAMALINRAIDDYEKAAFWQNKLVSLLDRYSEAQNYLQELSNLRYYYWDLKELDSVKAVSERLLSRIEVECEKSGRKVQSDSLYIRVQKDLIMYCLAFEDYQGIVYYAPKLLKIYEETGQTYSADYVELILDLILGYHNTNNYLEEYSLYEIYDKLADKSSEDYWSYLSLKAETLTYLNKFEEYDQVIHEWRILTEKLYGGNSREALVYNFQITQQYETLDQEEKAKNGINKCYAILNSKECFFYDKKDSLVFMASLHDLEGMVYTESDTQRAETKFLEAIEENKIVGGDESAPLLNIGYLYSQQRRDFKQALVYFEQAKKSLERRGDNFSVKYLTVLNNMAMCYQNLGMSSLAIAVFELASQTVLANYGKHHMLYGITEQNKSVFYVEVGNYSEAIKSCREAMECYKSIYGGESEKYAQCLQNLGLMYQYIGDYSDSKIILDEAILILDRIDSPYSIHAYINLLYLCYLEKDFDRLEELTEVAVAKLKEHNWDETDVAASLYGSVGYMMLLNGMSNAKTYLAHAVSILERIGGKASTQYYVGLLYTGLSLFLDNSQSEDFIPVLTKAYKHQYLDNAAYFNADERELLISGERLSQTKNLLFSLRQDGQQDIELYNFLLFNKGLLLETSIGYADAVYGIGNKEIITKYEDWLKLNRFMNGETVSFDTEITFNNARKQASALEREITIFLRQRSDYTNGLDYTFYDIRTALDNKEIAIEFVTYHNFTDNTNYYAAMLCKKDSHAPQFVTLCKKDDLEKLVLLSSNRLYGETSASEEMYRLIWEPLMPYLTGVKTVYFSPAGYINRLSVENLYDGKHRFNEFYDAVRVSSTRELCKTGIKRRYTTAVLYGGIWYDEDDATMVAESRNIREYSLYHSNVFGGPEGGMTRNGWKYLQGTLEEVNQISSILSKYKVKYKLYTSGKGNEESFKALTGSRFDILHIATHGFYMTEKQAERNDFFSNNPFMSQNVSRAVSPLQRAGLLMAGGNKAWKGETIPAGIEDGILTASEIASLDLSFCDIVVLSACETGLGEITDEGVYGLQRAFKNAGVKTIIMSLWEVDDQATSLMMQTFYCNLVKGKSKQRSFKAAQNEVKKKYSDPHYWAAFIMLD